MIKAIRSQRFVWAGFLLSASIATAFDGDPFYERLTGTNDSTFLAVRPFYSHVKNPEEEKEVWDYLWPVYTRKYFKSEKYSRFLFFSYTHNFTGEKDGGRIQKWVLPVWFQGRDAEGNGYFAIFPLGGTIHDFLGRDRILFVLFPLFGKSSINEVKTTSILWPIYSKTRGDKVERFRIFPLYGRTQLKGEYDKRFLLWPFWTAADYFNEKNEGSSWILFPIYGQVRKEKERTTWVIPPFFRFTAGEQQITYCPWPFFQRARGKVNRFALWPFFGKKQIGGVRQSYYVWPFFWSTQVDSPQVTHKRKMLLPIFFYESARAVNPAENDVDAGKKYSTYWKVWPLMSWQRERDAVRFRMVELWPFRNTPAVERNWAPIWSLYTRESTPLETSQNFLWGFYRQTKYANGFECSLLKGLFAYRRTGTDKKFSVLFIPFAKKEVSP